MTEHYHFIGIGGIGMSGLAKILLQRGVVVSGSDITHNCVIEALIQQGAHFYLNHSAENIIGASHVIYNADIKPENPEYQAAVNNQCSMMHRADLLASLIKGYQSIAVAGTHGKTTTSSLLVSVFLEAGWEPSFAVGGILPSIQTNAIHGNSQFFVLEADESDCSFLKYSPFGAIVTNIDRDHLNNFENSYDVLVDSFKTFMSQVQSKEWLLWCCDDPLLREINHSGFSYGFHPIADWRIVDTVQEGFRFRFDLEHKQNCYKDIDVALAGKHNVLNAAAVFALALSLGIPEEKIRIAFKTFSGVMRRCENKGEMKGILFLDDYAHHPTEITATLDGIRKAIGLRRLVVIFQPHRYTRTKDCLGTYGNIFDVADELFITDIYAAGEQAIPNLSHEQIIDEVRDQSKVSCQYIPRQELAKCVANFTKPGDVVVTLGAGDITKLSSDLFDLMSNSSDSC